jgi:hypothetical protein
LTPKDGTGKRKKKERMENIAFSCMDMLQKANLVVQMYIVPKSSIEIPLNFAKKCARSSRVSVQTLSKIQWLIRQLFKKMS